MGGIEYSRVNLSYIDKQTGQETFVTCKELGSSQIIPEGPLAPGDLFTVGFDPGEGRYSLYRIQVTAIPGGGRFNVVAQREGHQGERPDGLRLPEGQRQEDRHRSRRQRLRLEHPGDEPDAGQGRHRPGRRLLHRPDLRHVSAARSRGDWWSWGR